MARFRSLLCTRSTSMAESKIENQRKARMKGDPKQSALILENFKKLTDEEFKDFIFSNLQPSEIDKPLTFEFERFCCCDIKVMLDLELGRIQSFQDKLFSFSSQGQCPHVTEIRQHSRVQYYGTLQRVNDYEWNLNTYGKKVVYRIVDFSSIRLVHFACGFGKLDLLKTLVSVGCSLECMEKSEVAVLDLAIIYGHKDIFDFLISIADDQISARSIDKAALYNREDMLLELLNSKSIDKPALSSALVSAYNRGHTKIVKALLSAGAIPNKETISDAVSRQDLAIVELYLSCCAEIHPEHVAKAVKLHNIELLELLLTQGWTEEVNKHLSTPLIVWTTFNNEVKLLRRLIELNADKNVNKNGYTALDWALVLGWAECIQILENEGARSNPEISLASPPLYEMWFIDSNIPRADMIDRLVTRGYDVNNYSKNPHHLQTPCRFPALTSLCMAVQSSDIPAVRCLLKHGANPFFTKFEGVREIESPIHFAIRNGKWAVVEEMVISNIVSYQESKNKSNFLESLCQYTYEKYLELFLKCGWKTNKEKLLELHKYPYVRIQEVLKEQINRPIPSLSALCRNSIRFSCGTNIHKYLESQCIPTKLRQFLSLQDVIDEVRTKYNINDDPVY